MSEHEANLDLAIVLLEIYEDAVTRFPNGRGMMKRYECGHREFAGEVGHGLNAVIDLQCAGKCRQCR